MNLETFREVDQSPASSEKFKVPSKSIMSPDFACAKECISEFANVAVANFLKFRES